MNWTTLNKTHFRAPLFDPLFIDVWRVPDKTWSVQCAATTIHGFATESAAKTKAAELLAGLIQILKDKQ